MDAGLKRQLKKTALISIPMIVLMVTTPVFLLAKLPIHYYLLICFLGLPGPSLIWFFHYQILLRTKSSFLHGWFRVVLVSLIMSASLFVIIEIINPQIRINDWAIDARLPRYHIFRTMIITVVNIFVYILSDLIITRSRRQKLDEENHLLRIANLESRFRLLKDQINPHFIFNALNTAKSLVRNNPVVAEEYIVQLSELLRAGIASKDSSVPLAEELDLAGKYISLQQKRFGEALVYDVQPSLKNKEGKLPHFALVTLLENAVKHNAMTVDEPLTIRVEEQDGRIVVRNTLREKIRIGNDSGTGLNNLDERYRLLGSEPLRVEKSGKDFVVSIKLLES